MRDMLPGHAGMTFCYPQTQINVTNVAGFSVRFPLSGWICVSDTGMRQRWASDTVTPALRKENTPSPMGALLLAVGVKRTDPV